MPRSVAAVESLEGRTLLAVSFAVSDLAGTYSFMRAGAAGRGAMTLDAGGNVTSGSYVNADGRNVRLKSGVLSLAPDGTVGGFFKTTDAAAPLARVVGSMSSTKDAVALNDTLSTQADEAQILLLRTATSVTNDDVAGTWRVGEFGQVTFDANGRVTGGKLGTESLGVTVSIAGGRYTAGPGGLVSGFVTVVVPDTDPVRINFSAEMNRARDLAAVALSARQLDEFSGVTPMIRAGAAHATGDLAGTWRLVGEGYSAIVNFDGAGRIIGGTRGLRGDTGSASGGYDVRSDGTITGRITIADGTRRGFEIDFQGTLNRSRNVATGIDIGDSIDDVTGLIFVRSDAAFARVSGGRLSVTGTAAADITGLSARNGTINVTQNGVTQKFPLASVSSIRIDLLGGNDLATLGRGIIGSTLDGGPGKDTLIGGDGDDILIGGLGNDSLVGGNGFDTLYGNDGNDVLEGQGNGDSLRGGRGNDTLRGGKSNDRLFGDAGADLIDGGEQTDSALTDELDTILNIERFLA